MAHAVAIGAVLVAFGDVVFSRETGALLLEFFLC